MTHICPMTNDAHFNKEGFLESPTEDDPVRIQCLDFDCYCGICDALYKEDARDAAYQMELERGLAEAEAEAEEKEKWEMEEDIEKEAEWEESFPIEEEES